MALASSVALEFIRPTWNAPLHVQAAVTTRAGGVSHGSCSSLNLADHVGDDPAAVQLNRQRLAAELHLPSAPRWLVQVHGTDIVHADDSVAPVMADAAWTQNGWHCLRSAHGRLSARLAHRSSREPGCGYSCRLARHV